MSDQLQIKKVKPGDDFGKLAELLRRSFITVADEFGLTRDNCSANSAFIDKETLKNQLTDNREFYHMVYDNRSIGFIAIEKSVRAENTFYIEKVAVLPEFRHRNFGRKLVEFAVERIKTLNGLVISIGLIDENIPLKNWYVQMGFHEIGKKNFSHLPFIVCFMEKKIR
jgi:diamine N-acetyltransferase